MKSLLIILLSFFALNSVFGQTLSLDFGGIISGVQPRYSQSPSDTYGWDYYKHEYDSYFSKLAFGWNASVKVDYLLKKRFFISSRIGYLRNGSGGDKHTQNDGDAILTTTMRSEFQFLTANTLFNLKLNQSENAIVYVGVGPQLSYLLSHRLPDAPIINQFMLNDYVKEGLFGIKGVLGLKFNVNHFQYGFNVGCNYNFSYLLDHSVNYPEFSHNFKLKIYNFYSNLSLGYNF